MIRWGAIVAAVFAMGLAAGVLLSRVQAGVAPESSPVTLATDTTELATLRTELARLEEDRAILAARNDALESEAEAMRNEQSMIDDVLLEAATPEEMPEPTQTATPSPFDGDQRRGDRPQPTPEQMAEFRKNFEDQQTRMQERLTEQLTAMNDPNAIENYNTLMAYQQEEQQLRRQLRDAKTDDAREKIEAQLRDARQAARQTLNDQQDAMLQRLAASSGIKSTDAQQKFINDLRATLDNPFFRMEPMLVGGGPGRGGPRGMGFGGPRSSGTN